MNSKAAASGETGCGTQANKAQPHQKQPLSGLSTPFNLDYYISVLNLPIHMRRPPLRPLDFRTLFT
jgi:hypothetical protein